MIIFNSGVLVVQSPLRVSGNIHEKINKRAKVIELRDFLRNNNFNKHNKLYKKLENHSN